MQLRFWAQRYARVVLGSALRVLLFGMKARVPCSEIFGDVRHPLVYIVSLRTAASSAEQLLDIRDMLATCCLLLEGELSTLR